MIVLIIVLCEIFVLKCATAKEPTIKLRQGVIVGVQIYPENYSGSIHAYMGIPYAAAPVGHRRFAPPERHTGWNKTLFAAHISPNCPHNSKIRPNTSQSEDCLYLNIWTPVISEKYNRVPVVIFFDGDDFSVVNPLYPIPGQDLAAEGVVVVTVNYRLNVFGFLCLGNSEARGNLGLLDQYMSLLWIQENIEQFGGDRRNITLMGYSSGAASVIYHLTSPRTRDLFSRVIIMSGSIPMITNDYLTVVNYSLIIARRVGCRIDDLHMTIRCLRNISTQDILAAFDEQYQNDQIYPILGPVVDNFLLPNDQYLVYDPIAALNNGQFWNLPVLIGLNSLEVVKDEWIELFEKGYEHLYEYIIKTFPKLIEIYTKHLSQDNIDLLIEFIKWQYFRRIENDNKRELLTQIQRLYSHVMYDAPIFKQIEMMQKTTYPIYVYRFDYSRSLVLNTFNFSGSIHGNDLTFLFGPTLFQQITRRRANHIEKYLMKQMKNIWANFIKFGHPLGDVSSYGFWKSYNESSFIQIIGDATTFNLLGGRNFDNRKYLHEISLWTTFVPNLNEIVSKRVPNFVNSQRNIDSINVYRHATYTLTGLVIALLLLLLVCIILIRQRAKERQRNMDF